MPDFWPASSYNLLARSGDALTVTDDFIRSFFLRPEVAPVAESCAAELKLHELLLATPRRTVAAAEILQIADPDARANYRILLKFRDRLLAAPTLEAAYIGFFKGSGVDVPPIFLFQLTQIFLRHILGADADALEARMAECLFRVQTVSVLEDGAVMVADEETIEVFSETGGFGSLGELLKKQNTPTRSIDLDVLSTDNAAIYWQRD